MAGSYVKCLARKQKADGNYFTCYKKKGHHLSGGRDNRKHVDNKQAPAVYWEADDKCFIDGCIEPVDPYNPHNEPDDKYCDLHLIEELESRAALARKGIY